MGGTGDKLRAVWGEHRTPRGTPWRMERQRMGPCVETRQRNCGQGGVSPALPALPESPGWRHISPLNLPPSPPGLTLSRRWSVSWEQPGSVCWARAGGGFGKTCRVSVRPGGSVTAWEGLEAEARLRAALPWELSGSCGGLGSRWAGRQCQAPPRRPHPFLPGGEVVGRLLIWSREPRAFPGRRPPELASQASCPGGSWQFC